MTDMVSGDTAHSHTRTGMTFERLWSTEGVHPYDQVTWERRDVVQTNWKTGETVFEQRGVEFPESWSINASTIVTTKYFRGAVGADNREWSLRQLIDRVVLTYVKAGREYGYFATDHDADVFEAELTYMLLHQIFSFNSPVWFNVGTAAPQQVSACFILSVDDTMDSILNWYKEEGFIFKGGSGAGLNLSRIRSSKELLSSGGTASGPVSFMRGADASAGTIKSGGATRRAAKMVVLDVDHPDIEEFIETKVREEDKIRALKAAGFDMDLGGKDIVSVQYQNANNSVRVSDEFMRAVEEGTGFGLRARSTGEVIESVDARQLFRKMCEAAWACADPGIQYDDTINDWHTNPETGRINASNPCSEYMSLDNSSCNLASLNLMKFLKDDDTFDSVRFAKSVEYVITAMDISICFADFPTEAIGVTTRDYRQLGIGYANLGALLMATGLPYDSEGGRALAGAITSLMTGTSYKRSAELAGIVGPYSGYARNAAAHQRVMRKHAAATDALRTVSSLDGDVAKLAAKVWEEGNALGVQNGWRNAQASVLAPTGTIGFMMDCDTTGVEPDIALVKYKKLVGGGLMKIVNQTVPMALRKLGYTAAQIDEIIKYIDENETIEGAPGLRESHLPVFDCAFKAARGQRSIHYMGHIKMMGATQPFISGAISKTVNVPKEATVDDITQAYVQSWKLGAKAISIYRDGSKRTQPLNTSKDKTAAETTKEAVAQLVSQPVRRKLPDERRAITHKFDIQGHEGYITVGLFEDGQPGEIFLVMAKEGSTISGFADAFAQAISYALQYGVPLQALVDKFSHVRFEPSGMTKNAEIRFAKSIVDYIFRWLASKFLSPEAQFYAGVNGRELDEAAAASASMAPVVPAPVAAAPAVAAGPKAPTPFSTIQNQEDAPPCSTCGSIMIRSGACYKCVNCGNTSGCA